MLSLDLIHTTDNIIKSKPLSIPRTTKILDMYITVDYESQFFSNHIKHNHGSTERSSDKNIFGQVPLGSDTLQSQKYTTTHMTRQELPPSVREYP